MYDIGNGLIKVCLMFTKDYVVVGKYKQKGHREYL